MWLPFRIGRFEVTGKLRYSHWSEVLSGHAAEGTDRGVRVAIKRPTPTVLESSEATGWFRREGTLLSDLSHPAFPQVLEFTGGSSPILVMEHLDGADLATLLQVESLPTMPIDGWKLLLSDWLGGLDALHEGLGGQKVSHGDVSRGNLHVDCEGRGRLLDLGLAFAPQSLRQSVLKRRHEAWTNLPTTAEEEFAADIAGLFEAVSPFWPDDGTTPEFVSSLLRDAREGRWKSIPTAAHLYGMLQAQPDVRSVVKTWIQSSSNPSCTPV